jgi:DNA-binding transcriptional MerR regulator
MECGLRTSQVAAAAGVNIQTLRFYERRGVLPPPRRTPGGHRIYQAQTVTLVRMVKTAQQLGFTLDEIVALLRASRASRRMDPGLIAALARRKLAEIDAQIDNLLAARSALLPYTRQQAP